MSDTDTQWRFLAERYELLGQLGAGSVGAVWLVRDREGGVEYAIKILKPELTVGADAVAALLSMLETVRGLGHPNIVAVDDVVAHEGRVALTMRPVPGEDLRVLLGRMGTLAPAHTALLVAQLCDALAAAHAAEVTHGGIKPANVLLEPSQDEAGSLRLGLTDFGVAQLAAAAGVTPLEDEVGRAFYDAMPIEYQAPEIGVGCVASPAADVYAVGMLLYEALTGRPAFTGSPEEVHRMHAAVQPPRIAGLPDPLWLLIAACLDKHPQHRPSAHDLASLLREVAPTVQATAQRGSFDPNRGSMAAVGFTPLGAAASRREPCAAAPVRVEEAQWAVRGVSAGPPLLTAPAEHTQALDPITTGELVLASQAALPPSSTLVAVGGAPGVYPDADALAGSRHVFTTPRRMELAAVVAVIVLAFAATWLFSSIGSGPPGKGALVAAPTLQPSSTLAALDGGGAFGTAMPSGTASGSVSASASASPSRSASAAASPSGPAASPSSAPRPSPSPSAGPPSPSPSPGQGGGGGPSFGWMKITNVTSGLVLDSGGNVQPWSGLKQWRYDGSPNLQWQLVPVGNGYYRIVNNTNAMVVDSGGDSSDGATALESPWVGSDDQLWWLNSMGRGRFQIINRATGTALDGGGSYQIGSPTILWHPNRSTNNEWYISGA